jgi:type VI secretion system Hcp family effector
MDNHNSTLTLKLDGIKGESMIEPDALDILDWGWSMTNPSTQNGTGLSAGTPKVGDIHFQKLYCKGSPTIMQYLLQGKHFKTAVLQMRKTTGDTATKPYFTLELSKVFVTAYGTGANAATVDIAENFTISYETISVIYNDQKTDEGTLNGDVKFKYDVMKKQVA